ncbi:MAG: hypothetical protein ABID84_05205 [Chloroflexota bacterium]
MSMDIQGALRSAVGTSGRVNPAYGGFDIEVNEPAEFPWGRVLELLLALQHDVWVKKRRDRLVIMSKPPPV